MGFVVVEEEDWVAFANWEIRVGGLNRRGKRHRASRDRVC